MIRIKLSDALEIVRLRDEENSTWKTISEHVNHDISTCRRQYAYRKKGEKHPEEVITLVKTFATGLYTRKELWEKVLNTPGFSKEFLPCSQKTFNGWLYDEDIRYKRGMYSKLSMYHEMLKMMESEKIDYHQAARKILGITSEESPDIVDRFARGARKFAKSKTK